MTKSYRIEFTQPAKVEATKRGLSLPQLEAYLRKSMEDDGYHGGDDAQCYPPDLFFHTVDYNEPRPWMVYGRGDDLVLVDVCIYKEVKKLESGPLAGKTLMMPIGEEEDDESF